jgi:hypothetical protein
MPQEYRLVGTPDGFNSHIGVGLWDPRATTEAADNPDGWFPKDSSSFDFQVGGTAYLFSSLTGQDELKTAYWHIPTMTLIGSLVVVLIGVLLLLFSFEIKVGTILAAVLAILFLGLFWPSLVNSWLLSARPGIAAVIAIWAVAYVLIRRRSGASTPGTVAPIVAEVAADAPSAADPEAIISKQESTSDAQ